MNSAPTPDSASTRLARGGADLARRTIAALDDLGCRTELRLAGDRPALLTFIFHALQPPGQNHDDDLVDPTQVLPVESFERFARHFLDAGYRFVSAADLEHGLDPASPHVMVSFDDGYFNNLHAVPVLERLGIPATFFISTNHVRRGVAFWWDALHRARRDNPSAAAPLATADLKRMTNAAIERLIVERCGADTLEPRSDADRPMTPDELRDFARHPLVHIGNHTRDHAILPNYQPAEIARQIDGAQTDLADMTGEAPAIIAYPNGSWNPAVVTASRAAGLRFGLTLDPVRNPLPLHPDDEMTLGRFCFTQGHDQDAVFRGFRARWSLRRSLRGALGGRS